VVASLRPVGVEPLSAEIAIRVKAAKTFRGEQRVRALDEVSFEVPRGHFVSVLGPSGCGKSTLLRIVAGLLRADVGVVFQTYNLLPWLTVEKNIRLAAEVQGFARAEIDKRVEAILPVLGLDAFRDRFPHVLSGGMRQRTALGQILVLQPEVLLLDEPFGALDALTRDKLNVELLRLWQEMRKTVLLVTHSIAEAVFLSDRVLVMSERPGRILEDLAIELPRPRDPRSTKLRPEFAKYVLHLGGLMGVE
jgi:NitT/TauT family transport system ATP-binding protein